MGCKLGTSVLGFEADREAFLDDGVLEKYGVGLYGSEEASAATILHSTYLEKGKTRAALIAPLAAFREPPQVVVFTADSEQVMWLLYAVNYDQGGRMDLPQSGGALGGCADITALVLLQGIPNVTFLGLGCRLKSALNACHLMMGVPGNTLAALHQHLLDLAKPIAMLRKGPDRRRRNQTVHPLLVPCRWGVTGPGAAMTRPRLRRQHLGRWWLSGGFPASPQRPERQAVPEDVLRHRHQLPQDLFPPFVLNEPHQDISAPGLTPNQDRVRMEVPNFP